MPEHTPAPTPSRAVYGFAMFLTFRTFFVLYLIWAVVPEKWFTSISVTCLPQRYWAITVPIFLLTVLGIFGFVIYPNLGLIMTPNSDDLKTMRDSTCITNDQKENKIKVSKQRNEEHMDCCCVNRGTCYKDDFNKCSGDYISTAIPKLQDLNIWDVSDHLYLK